MVKMHDCLSPELWWANRRAGWRITGLIVVIIVFGWLTEHQQLSLVEAFVALAGLGLVCAAILDRVVDGTRTPLNAVLPLLSSIAQAPQPTGIQSGRW